MIKLDQTLSLPQRKELVEKYLAEAPSSELTPRVQELLADYLLQPTIRKKEKSILTPNRLVTINRHETSYQGMAETLESGEDGIYNLMTDNGKNTYITSRVRITEEDIKNNPELQSLRESISRVQEQAKNAKNSKERYVFKKWLIDLYQDQYVIKNQYRKTPQNSSPTRPQLDFSFDENIIVDADGGIHDNSTFSFFNPDHISFLLQSYSKIQDFAETRFDSDSSYLIKELDELIDAVLGKNTVYLTIVKEKIKGVKNEDLRQFLTEKFGETYSIEYLSVLWRKKIPKMLAVQAEKNYLEWYYTFQEYGKWKTCSHCKEVKLAHPLFFSKNKSSKDGFYSICKECRAKKYSKAKEEKL